MNYYGKKPINAYSVTFIIDGTSYTVNDVGSADRIEVTESGDTCEHLLIRYGTNNAELLADLMVKAMDYIIKKTNDAADEESIVPPDVKLILHGTENLEVALPENFWYDMGVFAMLFIDNETLSVIGENDGNYCKITKP